MPGFPFPGRPGGEHDEPLLDMIIARRALPPDAPREMHDLARMLAALAGPAEPGELAGEAAVRAAFSRAAAPAGISSTARRPVRHRRTRRTLRFQRPARSRARLAAVLVVAVAGLGSVLAAYTDLLPSPIQQMVAASAQHHPGPRGSTSSGAGQTAVHQARAARSQPAPRPHQSASPGQVPSQASSPAPHYTAPSWLPGYGVIQPACSGSPSRWPERSPTVSAHPSPWVPWPWPAYCPSLPASPTVSPVPHKHGP